MFRIWVLPQQQLRVYTSCQAMFEHLTVLDNTNNGLRVHGSFHGMSQILSSSILWGNAANQSWDQIDVSSKFEHCTHQPDGRK